MYLRGLGIGIVVTALLMGFSSGKKQTMTDEEIKSKAAALGMVEQESVLKPVITEEPEPAETAEKPEPEVSEQQAPADTQAEPETEEASEPEETKAEEGKPEETKKADDTAADNSEEKTEKKDDQVKTSGTFTIEIAGGSGSETVCALLEKGGAISSASDFDKYLCDHGYDHKIRAGKYKIPAGADYETIAHIITGK